MNDTNQTVYIPGIGETSASSIGDITRSGPPHFYLASYLNNMLTGLVAKEGGFIRAANDQTTHTLEINQNLQGSRIFLTFTEGNYQAIQKNIGLIHFT